MDDNKKLMELVKPLIEIWSKGGPTYQKEMKDYWTYDKLNEAKRIIRDLEK